MTKTILGLDLGTTSIGWALVREGENADIIKTGVRVIPLSTDEIQNFDKGKSITTNADRTLKRSVRRNLQRFKLRRANLIEILKESQIISTEAVLTETGNFTTFETYRLRAKSAKEQIKLIDLARVLLMINKKRGYKSSRKAKGEDDGSAIDGMEIAKRLYHENLTPGQLTHLRYQEGKENVLDFYRSDLQSEFDRIWQFQARFHSSFFTKENYEQLSGKTKTVSASILRRLGYDGMELKGTLKEKKKQRFAIRSKAVTEACSLNEIAEILPEINGQLTNSSGYLGAISDRSKELYFKQQTVGEFLYEQILENPHTRLKNQVFYRQDYLDEFNTIWEKQQSFYPTILTEKLKTEIRDVIIFYQRNLKSQKGLLSTCEFERISKTVESDGKQKTKQIGPKVCPKSSPLFQEFKIWAQLNNIEILPENSQTRTGEKLTLEEKQLLFHELNWKEKMSAASILKLLNISKGFKLNFETIDGNRTNSAILSGIEKFLEKEGYENLGFMKLSANEILENLQSLFNTIGIHTDILFFDSTKTGKHLENQPGYQFWHLLYSYEGDQSNSGIESLKTILSERYGFPFDTNSEIANISLPPDYSSLSSKAIKKILPHLQEGKGYDKACLLAGYNHSHSETKTDLDSKVLKEYLEILPKNSLRNPVVEKILNQMIHVVNMIVEVYGKPDEIRIEMARELKKNAKERELATNSIRKSTDEHMKYKQLLMSEFGLPSVSKNDLIRYKLYLELEKNGFKTLYSNTYIERSKLFSAEFDIEHIIPQSRLFDNSFSNKTLELKSVNLKKGNATAVDFILTEYGEAAVAAYQERVKMVFPFIAGSKTKHSKLLMSAQNIPTNFIERDLRDSQYIAKKAKEILHTLVRTVSTTTGAITDKLREDWQLVDVLKELNWEKYNKLGLIEELENRHGQKIKRIKDWTKRNDHRHHAMDAITVAFTKREYVKYLNNLNARSVKDGEIYKIQNQETYLDQDRKRRFNPPMPLPQFRALAKEHLENTFVSYKAKNKVSTTNKNITKGKTGTRTTLTETPRGQLHLETVYGSSQTYKTKMEKVGASFTKEKIAKVANKRYQELLNKRLEEFGGDPKKAFTGTNSLAKKPIYLDELHTRSVPETVKLVELETRYTIRKPISPDLKIEKVIDKGVQRILKQRLADYGGDPKKAFVNLDENPIFLNEEKGIALKSVTISGVSNAVPLHSKKDHFGKLILDRHGNPIPVDFVNTGNNHHVAIYRDEKGNLQEEVVTFFEAVTRKNQGLPIVKKVHEKGWEFVFTMKQNEYFVFPNQFTGFNPKEIDLLDPSNFKTINPNLFRVQKLSTKSYVFNHHLETSAVDGETLKNKKALSNITYKYIQSTSHLEGAVKLRLNHIGQIVHVGEY